MSYRQIWLLGALEQGREQIQQRLVFVSAQQRVDREEDARRQALDGSTAV